MIPTKRGFRRYTVLLEVHLTIARALGSVCRRASLLVALGLHPASAQRADSLELRSLAPKGPVVAGRSFEIKMTLEVRLQASDSARVQLFSNSLEPHRFVEIAHAKVVRGVQTVTLTARAVPVDWGSEGHWSLFVAMIPSPSPNTRASPLTRLNVPIDIVVR